MAGRQPADLTEGTEKDLQRLIIGGGEEGGWWVLCAVSRHGDWDSGHDNSPQESSLGCMWQIWSPESHPLLRCWAGSCIVSF